MTVAIRAEPGEWGGARLSDVEAVARSAADTFAAFDDGESVAIVLEATVGEDDPPMTLSATTAAGEFVVRLNVRGNVWSRLAYQFAHEYCHVLADPRTFQVDRFAWVEEALCETASLFALRAMAKGWAVRPPYPNWREYAASLAGYAVEHASSPARSLPAGAPFRTWLAGRLPELEADPGRREVNTIIAKELLPLFEADSSGWRAVRSLHDSPSSSAASLEGFLAAWAEAAAAHRSAVEAVAAILVSGE
jgi:hypothetical protein